MSAKIFLSYGHEDREIVLDLYQSLVDNGFKPWLDERELLPGMDWKYEIRHAIEESDLCIACFSSSSVSKRGFVQKERKYTLDLLEEFPEGGIFIIPVRLDKCEVPDSFKHLQYVDLFSPNGKQNFLDGLRRLLGQKKVQSKQAKNGIPAAEEPRQQKPLFNLNGQDWKHFEGQVEYYRANFSYRLFDLVAVIIAKLQKLTTGPGVAFYKTSQWQDLNLATNNLLQYLPQSHEIPLETWVVENIAYLVRNTAESYLELQDWAASKALYELALSLGVDASFIAARLDSIKENLGEIESLKQTRYRLIEDAISRDAHDQSIKSILEWFMEIDPDYRDIRKMWSNFIRS